MSYSDMICNRRNRKGGKIAMRALMRTVRGWVFTNMFRYGTWIGTAIIAVRALIRLFTSVCPLMFDQIALPHRQIGTIVALKPITRLLLFCTWPSTTFGCSGRRSPLVTRRRRRRRSHILNRRCRPFLEFIWTMIVWTWMTACPLRFPTTITMRSCIRIRENVLQKEGPGVRGLSYTHTYHHNYLFQELFSFLTQK